MIFGFLFMVDEYKNVINIYLLLYNILLFSSVCFVHSLPWCWRKISGTLPDTCEPNATPILDV